MPIYKQKEKNKDGLNKYNVRVNYTDGSGKHKQLTSSIYGLSEAKELERKLSNEAASVSLETPLTLHQLFKEYISVLKFEIRTSSLEKKHAVYNNHIHNELGDISITKLNIQKLTKWKTAINEKKTSKDNALKLRTKQNAYKELRAILNYAVKMEYLPANPLLKVGNFKNAYEYKKEVQYYTPEEFQKFIYCALTQANKTTYFDYYVFFNIAYFIGARKGEIHALRWSDIENWKLLKINKSISQKVKGGDVETPPKNKSSNRTVQLPLPLIKI